MTTTKLPDLSLTHGQALWAIAKGTEPRPRMKDEARYLRLLGIPFSKKEQGTGRGNKLTYDFDRLMELALALYCLQHGMKPKDVETYITKLRSDIRKLTRATFLEQSPEALNAWIEHEDSVVLSAEPKYLAFYDRYSDTFGKLEYPKKPEAKGLKGLIEPVTRMPNGNTRAAIPLTRIVLETVAWALRAPVIKTGPATADRKRA